MITLKSYVHGEWVHRDSSPNILLHAVTGEPFAQIGSGSLDYTGALHYARSVGGPNIRRLTFHDRAVILKELAKYLLGRKDEFYTLSEATGATKSDSWIDIEGGIGTLFVYSGKGRRELPNDTVYLEGETEILSKGGTFVGRHLCVPLEGTAFHINAFNFPCWGMLEKFAPSFLAGMPSIVKPASATAYLAEAMVRAMLESKLLPEGALQLICGSVGDTFDHLTCQDVVTFTGSAETGQKLRSHPKIVGESIRFNLEADSLNCCILGNDVEPGSEEFDLFVREVAREMTAKAGQKCTAIRRTIVPENRVEPVIKALSERLSKTIVGDPKREEVRMGPLASREQVQSVRESAKHLQKEGRVVAGDFDQFEVRGADREKGAFFPIVLLHCPDPLKHTAIHQVEAFGPVNTVMPYSKLEDAVELARRGRGSLVGSVITAKPEVARSVVLGLAPYHGRILVLNRDSAKESTGHGSPMPHLVHGGPGRAGGGEEMGGIRGVLHYMQRTALQGTPSTITNVGHVWTRGASIKQDKVHPFRKYFEELEIGETLMTHRRTVTESDIVNFAGISGDYFYAHMDDIAARESIFEKRVAHGYFVLSATAGLFVDPAPGPVLANYGLEGLRFVKPVFVGDTIRARLTCKQKALKAPSSNPQTPLAAIPQGVVAWDVEVFNQNDETVAVYTILTLVRCLPQ